MILVVCTSLHHGSQSCARGKFAISDLNGSTDRPTEPAPLSRPLFLSTPADGGVARRIQRLRRRGDPSHQEATAGGSATPALL